MRIQFSSSSSVRFLCWIATVIILVTFTRIVAVDRSRPQGFDEPAHIAAGMEWLQFGTYHLDSLHPPLARVAIAAPLYFAGSRFAGSNSASLPQFWDAGNSIIYQNHNYLHNLFLARMGVLVFFAILLGIVFFWTRRLFGDVAALASVILVSTLPVVLTFASLAYTDLPAACLQVMCVLVFSLWLTRPTSRTAAALGIAFGLAILAKFTSLLYIPAIALGIFACKRLVEKKQSDQYEPRGWAVQLTIIAILCTMIVWGGYRFSFGHIDELLGLQGGPLPTFQHFPSPLRPLAKRAIISDWTVPAPALWTGLGQAWVMNKSAPTAYLFGKEKSGGWWYFFIVECLFKTPLPFLLLASAGTFSLYRRIRNRSWEPVIPCVTVFTILVITMTTSTDYGLRHVLIVFPLLAIMAGFGFAQFWNAPLRWRHFARITACLLLAWQCVSALRPGADWIAYFNGLAGRDPSKILVTGCDLDCGQDILALSGELRRRHVSHVSVAVWTTADLGQMALPDFEVLEPFQPTTGWVAVGLRSLREGSVLHKSYPPGAFAWLDRYEPVAKIGSTVWLYDIPPFEAKAPSSSPVPAIGTR
jgi:4-amino-4-deoxy-L-arabinose transferase-like glycosyltransferase